MKLTWFGGTTVRVHVGRSILVVDPQAAPFEIDRNEIVSGADRVLTLIGDHRDLPGLDPKKWRPRKALRLMDEGEQPSVVHVYRIAPECALIDAVGEPQIMLISGEQLPRFGRWADDGVAVLFGDVEAMIAAGDALFAMARPRLLALAAGDDEAAMVIAALRDSLGDTGLMTLEPALALEV
ncbi:MAG: hypothetical protein JWR75_416 [Devosia sp.]|nr:hypothetical protein [Devosia sp.]